MNIIENIRTTFFAYLEQCFSLSQDKLANIEVYLSVNPNKEQFGDITTNAALILAKELSMQPRQLAQKIIDGYSHEAIEKLEIAGPGFINIVLTRHALEHLAAALWQDPNFFKLSAQEQHFNYNLEFVSANPTGPLHLGHGRGGIIGDVLGNILAYLGHQTTKEFYINDAGSQIERLGSSFKIRCQQQLGIPAVLQEDGYQGEYLVDLAKECIQQHGNSIQLLDNPDSFFSTYAKDRLLEAIKKTLKSYGITFDVWFSELSIHQSGAIAHALSVLEDKGYLYKKDDALWFASSSFGDDKDRVLRKSSGELTYFAPEVAYLENKVDRGFNYLIIVLGQDHHSYVNRIEAVMQALGHKHEQITCILYQLVTLKESGELVRMSKRAGRMVTLHDVIATVGVDVARFFYLNKKADAHLEFDIDLALKKTEENPVYYIQYAYVRIKSILEKACWHEAFNDIRHADSAYVGETERLMIKKIVSLKQLLVSISRHYQTHLLAYYVIELAQMFHSYYAVNRVIDENNVPQSRGRLFTITLVHNTLKLCFDLLGISAPNHM